MAPVLSRTLSLEPSDIPKERLFSVAAFVWAEAAEGLAFCLLSVLPRDLVGGRMAAP